MSEETGSHIAAGENAGGSWGCLIPAWIFCLYIFATELWHKNRNRCFHAVRCVFPNANLLFGNFFSWFLCWHSFWGHWVKKAINGLNLWIHCICCSYFICKILSFWICKCRETAIIDVYCVHWYRHKVNLNLLVKINLGYVVQDWSRGSRNFTLSRRITKGETILRLWCRGCSSSRTLKTSDSNRLRHAHTLRQVIHTHEEKERKWRPWWGLVNEPRM